MTKTTIGFGLSRISSFPLPPGMGQYSAPFLKAGQQNTVRKTGHSDNVDVRLRRDWGKDIKIEKQCFQPQKTEAGPDKAAPLTPTP